MKYQLVLQFSEELYGDLDWIIELENRLEACLVDAEVDGHDIGCGEINIFIHTNDPVATFEVAKNSLEENSAAFANVKVAYRNIQDGSYVCLWPKGLVEFKVS